MTTVSTAKTKLGARGQGIRELYYITHVDNVPSILNRGILSHSLVEAQRVPYTPIYDAQIVSNRKRKLTPDGKSLWTYANVYFQPRNPMLYRVVCERSLDQIAVIGVRANAMAHPSAYITTGNAVSGASDFVHISRLPKVIRNLMTGVSVEWWKESDGSKRRIMAECLIPDTISPDHIDSVYVANHETAERLRPRLLTSRVHLIPLPTMFFQPERTIVLTPKLSLVQGDMFFSRMQTLTVSVNCVGVMGKGLASRAKYQFPDVYVHYEDLCRNGKMRLGRPRIYKRETSFDYELADDPGSLEQGNAETWFLLFPTKQHWRQRASHRGIEDGLRWLQDDYTAEGIKSLAVPSLGCGLGWLDWADVGPQLCRALSTLRIETLIYLPTEKRIPEKQLSPEFLLR